MIPRLGSIWFIVVRALPQVYEYIYVPPNVPFTFSYHHSLFTNSRGSAIAKIVGFNAKRLPNFDDRVTMYVFEEMIEGKKLTEIINTTHENVKYLPGHKLPENVVSKFV